ncbi:lasso RiPP family leader peptide-containing protein [Streptomyces piniterrae]|uniref:Lasso RiPP family leader peptide-containing protein n=1 Tax=Streptomyces piniterrae TaxID=2571125 RepID=A0A4U0MUE1_9ACTN|nr:lasso RiPP family leader peptide-containing protein [Streptomyces piniterrae]TJZ44635.1 lasso RiPP family leader peptide-containing protein [Streptomyces piniterrae]
MNEENVDEEVTAYQTPVLVEVGSYTELTEGFAGGAYDGLGAFYGL